MNFDNLFVYGKNSSDSESEEELETAKFYLADSPSGKNGLINIAIRRIEIYREPYGTFFDNVPDFLDRVEYPESSGSAKINFVVSSARTISVCVEEPSFRPTVFEKINLLDTPTGLNYSEFGIDLGKMEEESYPEIPTGLPVGIKETRGRPND